MPRASARKAIRLILHSATAGTTIIACGSTADLLMWPAASRASAIRAATCCACGKSWHSARRSAYRLREAKFSLSKPSLFGKPIQMGANFYGRRFYYNQQRESSIFEFPRNMPVFDSFPPDDLLRYIRRGYGVDGFAEYQFRDSFSSVGVTYNYDISSFRMLTQASYEYYAYVPYEYAGMDRLSGVRSSTLTPSFAYNTIDHPAQPTRGLLIKIATAVTGLGGDVQAIEPSVEVKHFRSGFRPNHVIALHLRGRVLAAYGDKSQPPFDRYYMGGENDIRGFDTWSIGPIAYMPSIAAVNILNPDGTPRMQKQIVNGVQTFVNVTQSVPVLRPVRSEERRV